MSSSSIEPLSAEDGVPIRRYDRAIKVRSCLALVTDAFGGRGGIAKYNRDLACALSEEFRVDILARRIPDSVDGLQKNITQHRARRGRIVFAIAALLLAFKGPPTVIFCGHLYMLPVAALLKRMTGAKLVVQLHGIEAWQPPKRIVRLCVGEPTLWTAVSRHTRGRFLAWSNVEPSKVRVLPNTIGMGYRPGEKPKYLMVRHGLDGKRVILTVGRLAASERYKGHDRVIAALPDVLRRCPDAVYLIVGRGDDEPRLKEEARRAEVIDQTCFAGDVSDHELPDYFRLADVFAMPSTGEGFGIVFLEAAACGVPIVAGNRDGSVDALGDGALGTLTDPFDRHELVDAIAFALEGRSHIDATAAQRFEFSNFAKHANEIMRRLL